jgi:hypothetical protein
LDAFEQGNRLDWNFANERVQGDIAKLQELISGPDDGRIPPPWVMAMFLEEQLSGIESVLDAGDRATDGAFAGEVGTFRATAQQIRDEMAAVDLDSERAGPTLGALLQRKFFPFRAQVEAWRERITGGDQGEVGIPRLPDASGPGNVRGEKFEA